MDVGAWLRELGLGRYEEAFRQNDIDAEILRHLTAEDLTGLGIISIGHRRKLLAAIQALHGVVPALTPPSPQGATPATISLPQGERRQLTVMFVDLVGSTALAAGLDPEEMAALLRDYQDAVTRAIVRFEGHIAKYMGDGVLAYFGFGNYAPRPVSHAC